MLKKNINFITLLILLSNFLKNINLYSANLISQNNNNSINILDKDSLTYLINILNESTKSYKEKINNLNKISCLNKKFNNIVNKYLDNLFDPNNTLYGNLSESIVTKYLLKSIKYNKINLFKKIINNYENLIDIYEIKNRNPILIIAIENNNTKIIKILINNLINNNINIANYNNILKIALNSNNNIKVIKLLLKSGVNYDIECNIFRNPRAYIEINKFATKELNVYYITKHIIKPGLFITVFFIHLYFTCLKNPYEILFITLKIYLYLLYKFDV